MLRLFLAAIFYLGVSAPGSAQEHDGGSNDTPYAGLQDREIAGLSDDDLAELGRGGGWGLALPAELNGVPGPAHLLELATELSLTEDQVARIEDIHAKMQAEAIQVGERLIAAEAALTAAFRDGTPDRETLSELIASAETARGDLRFVHLSRHLETPPILTENQLSRYSVLRGYSDDPCADPPDGHDAALWRQHNGCS